MISLTELRAESHKLQSQIAAIEHLIKTMGGEIPVPFVKPSANSGSSGPVRRRRRRGAKRSQASSMTAAPAATSSRNGATTNEVILKALESGKDVQTSAISKACVAAGKSKGAVSVALNALRKAGKVKHGAKTGFWKKA